VLVISACLRDLSENNWGRGEGGKLGRVTVFLSPSKGRVMEKNDR